MAPNSSKKKSPPIRKRVKITSYRGILSPAGVKYRTTLECGHVWYSTDRITTMACYSCWPGIPNTLTNGKMYNDHGQLKAQITQ